MSFEKHFRPFNDFLQFIDLNSKFEFLFQLCIELKQICKSKKCDEKID